MNVRQIALRLLCEYEAGEKYINLSLSSHAADKLSREDRAALTALLYTTVEHKITYDYYICAISKRSDADIDLRTKNILRLGLCQIIDMEKIPDFAAVNETVKLAEGKGERAFVNGVLRAAVRMKDSLPMPSREKNLKRYLSVKYSFPLATVKHFLSFLSESETEALLDYYNTVKYTDITVNTVKISVDEYIKMLSAEGIAVEKNNAAPTSLRINKSVNPEILPGFSEGLFFVQDRASAISSAVLSPVENECVADVCAAPGGKSFAAAIRMNGRGRVYSFDLHESKLSLINSGAKRLGLSIIEAKVLDATAPDESLFGKMDKVICDAPCSGLGVLAKKPDIRYKDIESLVLAPLQLEILSASAKYLKDGGELVYSTCTLNREENEGVISTFLLENENFELVPYTLGEINAEDGMLTLLPHVHKTDGFFIAKLRKRKDNE